MVDFGQSGAIVSRMICKVRDELHSALTSFAPHCQQLLNPPATENAVCKLEKNLDVSLPSDYRELLKIHNGCHGNKLFLAFLLFSIDEFASKTQMVREDFKETRKNFTDGGWDSQKLMVGDSHVGWTLAIDCNSGTPSVNAQSNYALPLAESFAAYLVGLKDNARDGQFQVVVPFKCYCHREDNQILTVTCASLQEPGYQALNASGRLLRFLKS